MDDIQGISEFEDRVYDIRMVESWPQFAKLPEVLFDKYMSDTIRLSHVEKPTSRL